MRAPDAAEGSSTRHPRLQHQCCPCPPMVKDKKKDVSFWEKKEKNKEIGKRDWERKKFKNKI